MSEPEFGDPGYEYPFCGDPACLTQAAQLRKWEEVGAQVCDLLGELQPWQALSADARAHATRLTMRLAAML